MKFSARNESAAAAVAHCGAKIRSGRVLLLPLHHFFHSPPFRVRLQECARNKQEPLLVAADDVDYDCDCDVLQLATASLLRRQLLLPPRRS